MKDWDTTFLEIANIFAQRSSCVKRKVGAVLVKDLRVVSTGYNGTPSGFVNCDQVFKNGNKEGLLVIKHGNKIHNMTVETITHHDFAERYEIHAEQNCLMIAAQNGISTKDCTLYVTTAPCVQCAKLIIAAGIKRVVYKEVYKENFGLDLLHLCGIETKQID